MKKLFSIFIACIVIQFCCLSSLSAGFVDTSIDTDALLEEWYLDPDVFKVGTKYYDFYLNGAHFEGRRDWSERWEAIKNATSFEGKKVLDLGSQIGINSIFISKYLPIKSLVSVERQGFLIEKHLKLMKIFNQEYHVIQLDLERDEYEKILGYDYDIVVCLSLLKWIKKDKKRFLRYLSQFQEIIFEGHPHQPDVQTFIKIGFPYHKILAYTSSTLNRQGSKTRPIILFSKNPIE